MTGVPVTVLDVLQETIIYADIYMNIEKRLQSYSHYTVIIKKPEN